MTREEILAYCLAKPGAVPDQPWENDVVAKVGGKIFAFTGDRTVGVKCGRDLDEAAELRDRHPVDVTTMAYIGRYGWNTVRIDGELGDNEIRELIDSSYDDVVARLPKGKRPT
jgi:predicted DNA-binding protein (MmcQ/YjbR family)